MYKDMISTLHQSQCLTPLLSTTNHPTMEFFAISVKLLHASKSPVVAEEIWCMDSCIQEYDIIVSVIILE